MARHNEVTLYGQVADVPILMREDPGDSGSRILRALMPVMVIRGVRSTGAKDGRMRLDQVVVMSGNERIISFMSEWGKGDIVLLKGPLITQNYNKSCTCQECGSTYVYPGYSAYVYPIYVNLQAKGYTAEQGLVALRRNAEISNKITVIGRACSKPRIHRHEKSGTPICSYPIDIERKYHVKEDLDSNRHDFPIVKSYGEIAINDSYAIEKDGLVFIDGQLQVRNYDRTFKCPKCGADIKKKDNVTEIVPYSTEYLDGCHSMADVEAMREEATQREKEAAKQAAFDVTSSLFGEGGDESITHHLATDASVDAPST